MNSRILLTGATGFIGKSMAKRLFSDGYNIVSALRVHPTAQLLSGEVIVVGDIGSNTDWSRALSGVEFVVHCASRVHIMTDVSKNPLAEFRAVNVGGTISLAKQAAAAGVKRFIFLSSIKVNGESTISGHPFTADLPPNPADPYAVSKYEAEMGLSAVSLETGMEIVIIRSPLVYGPGVKANFLSMLNLLFRRIPLPLGAVKDNRRSFVYLDNLVDLIVTCIKHPAAANQIFLVSDDDDLSTTSLLQRLASNLGKPSKLIKVSPRLIQFGASFIGKASIAQRLCGSLQVDIKKTQDFLGWSPPVSLDDGLRQTAEHYLKTKT